MEESSKNQIHHHSKLTQVGKMLGNTQVQEALVPPATVINIQGTAEFFSVTEIFQAL